MNLSTRPEFENCIFVGSESHWEKVKGNIRHELSEVGFVMASEVSELNEMTYVEQGVSYPWDDDWRLPILRFYSLKDRNKANIVICKFKEKVE